MLLAGSVAGLLGATSSSDMIHDGTTGSPNILVLFGFRGFLCAGLLGIHNYYSGGLGMHGLGMPTGCPRDAHGMQFSLRLPAALGSQQDLHRQGPGPRALASCIVSSISSQLENNFMGEPFPSGHNYCPQTVRCCTDNATFSTNGATLFRLTGERAGA